MNAKSKSSKQNGQPARLRLILAGAVVVVLGVVLYFALGDSGNDSGLSPGGSGDGSTLSGDGSSGDGRGFDADTAAELLEYRMSAGKAYEYSFTRSMDASANGEKLVAMELGGLVTPNVVRSQDGRLDMIVSVRFDKTGGLDATELPAYAKGGGVTPTYLAYLQIDRTGRPLFLRFSADTADRAEQGLIRDVISAWLQPLPGPGAHPRDAQSDSWFGRLFGKDAPTVFDVIGTDTQGLYDAALQLNADDNESEDLRFDLAKKDYKDSLTPIRIEQSEHRIAWKVEHGVFGGSAGKDRFVMGPSEFLVDSSMHYVYNLNDVTDAQYNEADLARFTINADIYDVESYLSDREVEIPEKTKAKPWREIKPRLASVTADMPGEKRTEIFNTLAISVKVDPAMAADLAQAARGYRSDDHRFQMVMGALSYSGSQAAQNELLGMYQADNLDQLGRESVIDAFTMMNQPATPEALKFLQDTFAGDNTELSNRAGLALGSAQRNNPTENLRQWIRDRWRAAKTDSQKQTVLEYIGNSGDPELLPIIDEAFSLADFDLRRLALDATRFMDAPEVNTYLLKIFDNRQINERLRYEAMSSLALHRWEERFLPVMEACVQNEPMEAARMRCARFTLEQLRHERRMKDLLRAQRGNGNSSSWRDFVDRETAN